MSKEESVLETESVLLSGIMFLMACNLLSWGDVARQRCDIHLILARSLSVEASIFKKSVVSFKYLAAPVASSYMMESLLPKTPSVMVPMPETVWWPELPGL